MENTQVFDNLGLVFAAGGSSRRFGGGSKLLEELGGMPVFLWSLRELSTVVRKGLVVLSVPADEEPLFLEALKLHLPELEVKITQGGATRTQSVLNALSALPPEAEFAAIHDAARPFIKSQTLRSCMEACKTFGGAVAAKRVTDTIKEADTDGFIVKTLSRDTLWAMETPQVFPRKALETACRKALEEGIALTDDAAAMELYASVRAKLVENPHFNLKITYQSDLEMAKGQLPRRNN